MKKNSGFTLIELMIVIAIIAIIAAIAIPNLIEARKGSNEAAAIGALRTISTAQNIFREGDKDKNNTNEYASAMSLLGSTNLIDSVLSSGSKQGYSFSTVVIAGSTSLYKWTAGAQPVVPGSTGDRYFFIDESGVIRFANTAPATSASNPIGG